MNSISTVPGLHPAPTRHHGLVAWVEQIAALTKPARVHWCDGSETEKAAIIADLIGIPADDIMVEEGNRLEQGRDCDEV